MSRLRAGRVLAATAILLSAGMMLVGCDQVNGARAGASVTTHIIHTGRGDITCAVFLPNDGGGIDCDWEHPQ